MKPRKTIKRRKIHFRGVLSGPAHFVQLLISQFGCFPLFCAVVNYMAHPSDRVPFLAAALLVLSTAATVLVYADNDVNLNAVIITEPRSSQVNTTFFVQPVIRIVVDGVSDAPYRCTVYANASSLYVLPQYQLPGNPTPVIGGTRIVMSDTGEVAFTNLFVTQPGSYYHITFIVTATIDGVNRSWSRMSAAFHAGPAPPTTTRPNTTAAPTTTTRRPSPADVASQSPAITITDVPPLNIVCEPFTTQPAVALTSMPGVLSVALSLRQNGTTTTSVLSGGPTTINSNGGGAVNFDGLRVCGRTGENFQVVYTVTTSSGVRVVNGNPFTLIDPASTSPPKTPAPLSLATAKVLYYTQPASGIAGLKLKVQPEVRLTDGNFNIIKTTGTATATLMYPAKFNRYFPKLSGTATIAATDGIFAFTDLSVNVSGANYFLNITVVTGGRSFTGYSSNFIVARNSASSARGDIQTDDVSGPEFEDDAPGPAVPPSQGELAGVIVAAIAGAAILCAGVAFGVVVVVRRRSRLAVEGTSPVDAAQPNVVGTWRTVPPTSHEPTDVPAIVGDSSVGNSSPGPQDFDDESESTSHARTDISSAHRCSHAEVVNPIIHAFQV